MRIIACLLVLFNVALIMTLMILSEGQVYVLASMSMLLLSPVIISEMRLKSMLMRSR
jgi:hypothetical protein